MSRLSGINVVRSIEVPYESSHTLGDEITPDVVKDEFKDSEPHWSLYDEVHPKQRKFCCCFNSRTACISVCVVFWFIFIAVLGVAVFLLFPRIPKITIGTPYLPADNRGAQFNATAGALDTVTYKIAVNFTVDSTNFIDIFCSEIAIKANLKTPTGEEIENAFALGRVNNAVFKSFQKSTYAMPIDLYYRSLGKTIRQDPALMTLYDTVLAEQMGVLQAVYKIKVTIPLISWTGFTLSFQENLRFDLGAAAKDDQDKVQEFVSSIFDAIK